jgi:hypothetical protein
MMTTLLLAFLALGDDPTPAQIFEKRILPIFKSPQPSSCVDCHLAGVDLKNYILPSHEKTFLSLRDQGMIDLDKPAESKILRLIGMGDNQGAALVSAKVAGTSSRRSRRSGRRPPTKPAKFPPPRELAQPRGRTT